MIGEPPMCCSAESRYVSDGRRGMLTGAVILRDRSQEARPRVRAARTSHWGDTLLCQQASPVDPRRLCIRVCSSCARCCKACAASRREWRQAEGGRGAACSKEVSTSACATRGQRDGRRGAPRGAEAPAVAAYCQRACRGNLGARGACCGGHIVGQDVRHRAGQRVAGSRGAARQADKLRPASARLHGLERRLRRTHAQGGERGHPVRASKAAAVPQRQCRSTHTAWVRCVTDAVSMPTGVCTGVKSKRPQSCAPSAAALGWAPMVNASENGQLAWFCGASVRRAHNTRAPRAWHTLAARNRWCAGSVRSSACSERR